MLQNTTITQKWQMTLPKKIRDILEINSPGRFLVEVVDEKKKLIRIKKRPDILDLAGIFIPTDKKEVIKAREEMGKKYERF